MPALAIVYGVLLVILGLAGYLGLGRSSPTALIPAAFGLLLVALGARASRSERSRMHAMHAAAMLALLGFLGTAPGLAKAAGMAFGRPTARPAAAVAQAVMALLSAAFLACAVGSFVRVRRARRLREAAHPR